MSVLLSELLAETTEKTRNSTTGALDNTKRTRAINRVLEDLQTYADWEWTKRSKDFYLIDGVNEYSLKNYIAATCLDNDGSTSIGDFKSPVALRVADQGRLPFVFKDAPEVRADLLRNRRINEYSADNDLLVVNFPRGNSRQIHELDGLTEDGTWAASGDAINLSADTVEFKQGDGSLNFDVTAGTSLILTNSTFDPIDLTDFKNKSHFTLWVYLPTITSFTSIGLRWGSSASAYWEKTETLPAGSRSLVVGWNQFAFSWADATETNSPDVTAVDYLRIAITYGASTTDTDFRVDDLRLGLRTLATLEYYSLAMTKTTAGDYQLEFNIDTITQTDELLGGVVPRRTVVQGAAYELFEIIGGKSERDRTDSFKLYETQRLQLLKRAGHRVRRPVKQLNFPGRR